MNEYIKAGIIGHPVSHSKSPLIHPYWIRKYGLKGEYNALDIRPEDLKDALKGCMAEGFRGVNLTLPHKEAAVKLCHHVDALAKAAGAVNTIVFEDKKIYGFNTDIFGFTESITESEPEFEFKKGPAVVLGAGGAAHAVVQALLYEKAPEIRILNRTREKAAKLAGPYKNIKVFDWDERADVLSDANLLVNTTSLGLAGQPPLEIDLDRLNPKAVVHDIVYVPLHTPFLKQAAERGNHTVTGIGMLLHQARPAFKKWFGIMPDVDDDLRALVLK